MNKTANITVLGCGNSTGVPAICNYWGACDPNEPKNIRTRCSIAVQTDETTLIIDTGPNFREQINRENITRIDGILYTHAHSDHVNGIDELRVISRKSDKLVKIYGNKGTLEDLKHRFNYMFKGGEIDLYPPILDPKELNKDHFGRVQSFKDLKFTPFIQNHGTIDSVGYRFGDFAYSVDIWDIDNTAIKTLSGIKTWLVDCAAYKSPNQVHANLEKIYAFNEQIKAKTVYLTSLSLEMDYQTLCNELPKDYKPAYDGLKLECLY
ncbi:MAG: MBL fold metallo-hydrolase [Alphaproteobacteria bacterium]